VSLSTLSFALPLVITLLLGLPSVAKAQLTGLVVEALPTGLQVVLHDSQQASPVSITSASYGQVTLQLKQASLPPTLMVNTEKAPLVSHVLVEQNDAGRATITLQGHKLTAPQLLWQVPATTSTPPTSSAQTAPLSGLLSLLKQSILTLLQPTYAMALAVLMVLAGVAFWVSKRHAGALRAEMASTLDATMSHTTLPELPTQANPLRFGASRYATQPAPKAPAKKAPTTLPTVQQPITSSAEALRQKQAQQRYGQVAMSSPVAGKPMVRPSSVRTIREASPATQASKASLPASATRQSSTSPAQRQAFLEAMAAHAQTQGNANLANALRMTQR